METSLPTNSPYRPWISRLHRKQHASCRKIPYDAPLSTPRHRHYTLWLGSSSTTRGCVGVSRRDKSHPCNSPLWNHPSFPVESAVHTPLDLRSGIPRSIHTTTSSRPETLRPDRVTHSWVTAFILSRASDTFCCTFLRAIPRASPTRPRTDGRAPRGNFPTEVHSCG